MTGWRALVSGVAAISALASLLLPAVVVHAEPSFPDLLCACVTLACGVLLLAARGPALRSTVTGGLLLTAAAAWTLPVLGLVVGDEVGGVLASTTLVHLAPMTAAVLVQLEDSTPRAARLGVLVAAVLTSATATTGGYSVALPVLGALVAAVSLGERSAANAAGLVLGGTLLGTATTRAVGLGTETELFAIHALGLAATSALVTVAAQRRRSTNPWRLELDAAGLGDLEKSLGEALASPGLRVFFDDADGGWLDALGRRIPVPQGDALLLAEDSQAVAAVQHLRGSVPPRFVSTLRVVRDHARLRHATADQLIALAESQRRLLAAADAERHDLEDRLRSGALRHIEAVAASTDGTRTLDAVRRRAGATRSALLELARGLDPLAGTAGLREALAALADGVALTVVCPATADLADDAVRRTVWFVCAEAVANAVKHAAGAHVAIHVSVDEAANELVAVVADDGPGGADPNGRGLRGLADRVRAVGGQLDVTSASAQGTRVVLALPFGAATARVAS